MTPEGFWKRVDASGDCWEWTGHVTKYGYGRAWVPSLRDVHTHAHRVSYELLVGEVPAGLVLDHLCRNKVCVNPDHLEPVVQSTNFHRGFSASAITSRTDVCQSGRHSMDGAYTHVDRYGRRLRRCRECWREQHARYVAKHGRRYGPRVGSATHCKKGHEYTQANTLVRDGDMICRECGRESRARAHARRAAVSS